jgi:phosphohistidine phosphatase
MDLILWRHAEAEPGEPDDGRALTGKGHKQAEKMAQWLDRHLPDNCRILVSPAQRAQQTAATLARKYKTLAELAPGANCQAVLDACGWPDSKETVLVVGHQPTLGQVASLLVTGTAQEWSIRKGAVWWLSNRAREDADLAALRVVLGPDYL